MAAVRPTAWQWDLRARLAQLGGLVGFIGLGVFSVTGVLVGAAVSAAVMLGGFATSVLLALRVGRASDLERADGYSTIFDFPGFELRDGRTLEVLRTADVAPEQPGRRSLLRGMLQSIRLPRER
ncbi:hypothetical protein [Schumannella luteola]